MTKLEKEREAIKKKPKNFANLLELMRDSASMLEVYEYVEDFQKELRQMRVYPTNTKSVAVYDFIKELLEGDVKRK